MGLPFLVWSLLTARQIVPRLLDRERKGWHRESSRWLGGQAIPATVLRHVVPCEGRKHLGVVTTIGESSGQQEAGGAGIADS